MVVAGANTPRPFSSPTSLPRGATRGGCGAMRRLTAPDGTDYGSNNHANRRPSNRESPRNGHNGKGWATCPSYGQNGTNHKGGVMESTMATHYREQLTFWQKQMDKLTGRSNGYVMPQHCGMEAWKQLACQVARRINHYRELSQKEKS